MATRFYLPQSGTAPASPSYDSSWESVANAARMPLVTTPTNTALTSRSTDKAAATDPYDSLAGQWVSDALPAGGVSGTFTLVTGATEPTGSRDAFLQCVIRVVSGDGSTVRGTLYAGQSATVESATSTASNYEFALFSFKVRVLTASLSSVTAQAGDRIVVEYGSRACNANTYTNSVQVIIGDSTSASDLPATVDADGSTGDGRPWVEFSQDLFSGGGTTVDGAQATETDSALTGSVASGAVVAGTLATETDTAQSGTAVVGALVAGSLAVEVDLARAGAVSFAEYVNGTKATETDAALSGSVVAGAVVAGGLALEVDEALTGFTAAGDVIFGGTALEVDEAFGGTTVGPVISYTETTLRVGGRTRDGIAVAEWEPAVVPSPSIMVSGEHRRIRAYAFGPVTMHGPQPVYSVSGATAQRDRTRVMVGGKDVSFLDGVPTPEPEWQLAEPLLWGPTSVELPSIPAAFFDPADHPWLAKGKPVVFQRVTAAGAKVGVDYRGVVIAHDVSGKTLRLEVGGHGQGKAALRHKPLPIFRDTLDLGRLAWAAVRDLGLRFSPRLGPTTGIKQALFGGMDHLSYISEVCAKAFDADGQWSLMPNDTGLYSFARKDRTTVHWTLFNDDARVVVDLRSDAAEEPNRIFAGGVTPKGQRVRFGVYPGLKPGPAAPYPFDDDRTFGLGTLDAETDTGDGVTVMLRKLWTAGYLSLEEMDGFYDATVTRAVMALQDDAGKPTTGNMNPATWRALFDLDVTGYTLRGSRIEPAAQDYRVRRYNRSASGQFIERNPNFDPSRLIVDRDIDFGSGFTRDRMRDWARSEVYRGEDNWFGTITIHTGGILVGDVTVGASITAADVADVRDIRPGQNVRLPMFGGGILLHISGVEISRTESGHPVARLTVDTQARDALPVWEQIRRNRETRRDAGRRWKGNRASSQTKDSIDVWDEIGGVLYGDVDLEPGWNVIPVVAGQEGTVSRLRLVVQDVTGDGGEVVIQGREFACAVFGKRVTPRRLRTLIGNPLVGSPAATAEPDPDEVDPPEVDPEDSDADPALTVTASRPWWERESIQDELRNLNLLYGAGTHEEPCGYDPGRKAAGATKTGLHRDDAGFSYRTLGEPVLYVAVWVWGERRLSGGRIMWNQLEAGA